MLCEAMPGRLFRSGEYSIRETFDLAKKGVLGGPRSLKEYGSQPVWIGSGQIAALPEVAG